MGRPWVATPLYTAIPRISGDYLCESVIVVHLLGQENDEFECEIPS